MILSNDVVKAEVARYWEAFKLRDAQQLNAFYAHESVGFSSTSRRSEPGRMAAIRREREYFETDTPIEAEIDYIEIVQLSPEFAVACCTFTFRARRLTGLGKTIEEHIIDGRARQVFGCDPEGRIRIFHEHFSQAAP